MDSGRRFGSLPVLWTKITRIKSLFANIGVVVLLNLIVKPAWLLTENVVQNEVGHADMGMYAALLAFGFLFVTFSDFGLNQYTTKSLASQPELLKDWFPKLLSLRLIITIFFPLVVMVAGWAWGFGYRELMFLGLISIIHAGGQFLQFFRANLQAMQRFKLDGIFSVSEKVLLLLAVWALIYLGIDIAGFIFARVGVIILTTFLAMAAVVRLYGWHPPKADRSFFREVLKKSWPFAVITIVYSVHDKVDQVMLQRLAGEEETGLYVGAYRWLDAFSMYLWTVLPIFFARFAFFSGNREEKEKLLHFGQLISALPLIFVSVFVFFYGEKLLFLFTNSSPAELAVMEACLKALFVAGLINAVFSVFSTLLTATGHERFVNRLAIGSIVLNIALNWIFIPQYGAVASAWATVASYGLMAVGYLVFYHSRLDIAIPYRQMGLMLVAAAVLVAAFYFFGKTALPWWAITLIAGALYAGCVFLMRLLTLEKLRGFRVDHHE